MRSNIAQNYLFRIKSLLGKGTKKLNYANLSKESYLGFKIK